MKPDIKRKYQEEISYKLAQLPNKFNSAEKEWIDFKDITQGTPENMVGQKKSGGQQKNATTWWNEDARQDTTLKRQLYKMWLKDPKPQKKEKYPSARDACKQVTKHAKEKAWSEYGNQLEDMRKTEAMKNFYKKVKSMRERDQPYCPITTIKDARGQIITDQHQIKQRWGGFFEGLLNPNEDTRDNNLSVQDILEHEPEILRSEIEESLKSAKTGKSPGIDGISIEIIKAAGEARVELLWKVCRSVWKDGIAPMDWRQSIIIPTWKRKGDIRDFSQYRVISLLSQPSKVFAKILEKRIRCIAEPQLSDNQFGFRKNNGCSDSIFILRQLQEKHIDRNKPLNMAFIDQEKAFDRVVRAELWKCLPERDIFGELLRAVQSLYICSQAAVRTTKGETDLFEVKCGLRQGCVLSPSLFIIFMDNVMKRANHEENSTEDLMFADDSVLIAEDQSRLQEMVSNLDQQCKNYGMRISRDKTEVMVTSREPIQCDIE